MTITSPAFGQNEPIPKKYTCDGENINPPLVFGDVPREAKSLALVVNDPDAPEGNFVHWLVWNIMPERTEIKENSDFKEATHRPPENWRAVAGTNGFGNIGYGGPCPPAGEEHRYFFRLYALDIIIELPIGSMLEALNLAMGGHIITENHYIGVYKRPGDEKVASSLDELEEDEVLI